jgi:hypothetical protein
MALPMIALTRWRKYQGVLCSVCARTESSA